MELTGEGLESSQTSTSIRTPQRQKERTKQLVSSLAKAKHTAAGIPTWSPTVVLICRSTAYVWQSGRDAQFSADCGRMCLVCEFYHQ
ncbi:hypothetical protein KCU83_g1878, partial [Aureobasidium melanogenum]